MTHDFFTELKLIIFISIIYSGDGSLTGRKLEPGFLCSNGTILGITQMCDGTADCGSGEDETNLLCASECNKVFFKLTFIVQTRYSWPIEY